MISKNGKTILVAFLVLLFAGQPIASAAVASMGLDKAAQSSLLDESTKASCHKKQGSHHESAELSESNDSVVQNSQPTECCDIDCHCPSGGCSPVAITINVLKNASLTSVNTKNLYNFQWPKSQMNTSLYRPPILR